MIIDVHAHCDCVALAELVARVTGVRREADYYPPRGGVHPPASDTASDIEKRIQIMDGAGVAMQVLSNPRGAQMADEDASAEGARLSNDSYANIVRQYPKRFAAYGTLPLPHTKAALREAQRCLDDLGMIGVTMGCSVLKTRSPIDDEFMPIYEELNRRGCALYFHPSGNGLCTPFLNDWDLTYSIGAPLEDTVLVGHLMAKAIPVRFPNIKIVVAHFGGAIPMLLHRMDHEAPPRVKGMVEPPSVTARRLWYDTTGHGSIAALTAGVKAYGADRLMAGSDFRVHLTFEEHYSSAFDYIEKAGLSADEVEGIYSRNAINLLGLNP